MRTGPSRLGDEIRGALIAITIGVTLSGFFIIGRRPKSPLSVLLNGAVVGFCIYALISFLELFFRRPIDRLPRRWQAPLHAVLFMFGGIGGWFAGLLLAATLSGEDLAIGEVLRISYAIPFMLITAAVAMAAGLLLRFLEQLFDRVKEREWAEKELELARAIQKRLLPPETIEAGGLLITSRNVPAHIVAGDFYDVVRLDDGAVVVVVADVAGKGIAASLIMASVKAVLPFVSRGTAAEAMGQMNEKLIGELGNREFVAMVYARFAPGGASVEIVNAGCPDPYLISPGAVRELSVAGPRLPLGLRTKLEYESITFDIRSGERLLLLSDGIPEAPSENEQPLGYQRLAEIVSSMNGAATNTAPWLDVFLEKVRAVVMPELTDDWTAVVVERR